MSSTKQMSKVAFGNSVVRALEAQDKYHSATKNAAQCFAQIRGSRTDLKEYKAQARTAIRAKWEGEKLESKLASFKVMASELLGLMRDVPKAAKEWKAGRYISYSIAQARLERKGGGGSKRFSGKRGAERLVSVTKSLKELQAILDALPKAILAAYDFNEGEIKPTAKLLRLVA